MELKFHTLDVFTRTRFGGNPLAVVLDADDLDGGQMQTIAAEFNLSETVFVMKPERPAHSAKVRIFTPSRCLIFSAIRATRAGTSPARSKPHWIRSLAGRRPLRWRSGS